MAISPIVILELKFLEEIGKIAGDLTKLQEIIEIELGISIEDRSVSKLTMQALSILDQRSFRSNDSSTSCSRSRQAHY